MPQNRSENVVGVLLVMTTLCAAGVAAALWASSASGRQKLAALGTEQFSVHDALHKLTHSLHSMRDDILGSIDRR